MRRSPWIPAAAASLLAASAALADNAAADLLAGDRLHGNIVTPGERDVLSLYLPAGAVFSVGALAERGSTLLPDLEMIDPDGDPVFLDLVKIPGPGGVGVRLRNLPIDAISGGVYDFRVLATEGTSGKYFFRCTARMPRKFAGTPLTGGDAFAFIGFDAPAGSKISWSIRPLTPGAVLSQPALVSPSAAVTDLPDLSGGGVVLGEDGTWMLRVFNETDTEAEIAMTATLVIPRSRRNLYLSPFGFGPPPKVTSVTPKRVLDDDPVAGMSILGTGFDPAAVLRLERGQEAPLLPTAYTVDHEGSITADFEFTGAPTGAWKVVVENPSGGAGKGRLVVQSAAGVRLPPGAIAGTEVWWLDFDGPAFREDLKQAGLQSPVNSTVSALAEAAVKSYALRWLRLAFDLDPQTGRSEAGVSVPVSFILSKPPSTVGEPGTEYDRLVIGGAAALSDPSSNPNYAWGDGPLDTGNAAYEDIDPGVRSRLLAYPQAVTVPSFYAALKSLRDQPLGLEDGRFFLQGFFARSGAEGQRYAEVVLAVEKAGKELGGTIAHFVARSLGTPDGATGLAATPLKVGEFDALLDFGFTGPETAAMAGVVREGLPGKSKILQANVFPYTETRDYLLPDAITTQAYGETFAVAGGRPERDPSDLEFTLAAGVLPPGFSLDLDGTVSGTAPLRFPDNTLVGGVARFLVRMRDKPTGAVIFFAHRINVLVDVADPSLSPAEVALGNQRNAATLNEP